MPMIIKSTFFTGSFTKVSQCPQENRPEYAFIGRSNVGKSSLINMLCERKDLARISNTPGKTQHLNYYLVNDEWNLVDLPGYGYAKISKKKRAEWRKMIDSFLLKRENLCCVFLLIDGSIPPQKIDLEFINKLGEMRIPFVLVFTKTDKGKPAKNEIYRADFFKKLQETWEEMPQHFVTSSNTRIGREELLQFIQGINEEYEQASVT